MALSLPGISIASGQPLRICLRIVFGSSFRGLSSVMTVKSELIFDI